MNRKGHTLSKPSSLKQLMLGTPGVHSSREIRGASGDPVCPLFPLPLPHLLGHNGSYISRRVISAGTMVDSSPPVH